MRVLKREEIDLISVMVRGHAIGQSLLTGIERLGVRDLHDGDMGSIQLLSEITEQPRQAECIAEADYMDFDGIPVSIAINVDQHRKLFELDIWTVDFSPLQTYPTPRTIRNLRHT